MDGVGPERHAPVAVAQGKKAEACWISGPVWVGKKNLTPTGLRNQDRPSSTKFL